MATVPYTCHLLLQMRRPVCKASGTVGGSSWKYAQTTRWPHHIHRLAIALIRVVKWLMNFNGKQKLE